MIRSWLVESAEVGGSHFWSSLENIGVGGTYSFFTMFIWKSMLHTLICSYFRGGYCSVLVEKILRGGDIRGLLLCCYFGLQQQQPQLVSPMSFLNLIPTMQYLTSFVSVFTFGRGMRWVEVQVSPLCIVSFYTHIVSFVTSLLSPGHPSISNNFS